MTKALELNRELSKLKCEEADIKGALADELRNMRTHIRRLTKHMEVKFSLQIGYTSVQYHAHECIRVTFRSGIGIEINNAFAEAHNQKLRTDREAAFAAIVPDLDSCMNDFMTKFKLKLVPSSFSSSGTSAVYTMT